MRFFVLIFTALTLMMFAAPSFAEDMPQESLIGFSETEKVGFAFYHLINKTPPYMDWIAARTDYIKSTPGERMRIMDYERPRLRDGFANYQVDREMILVKLPLLYTLTDNPDYHTDPDAQSKGLTKRLLISLPDSQTPYFPFQVGKFWVGVIPQGLEKSMPVDLTEEEYDKLAHGIVEKTKFKNKSIITTVLLKPIVADDKKPMVENNMPVFLLMSDIATLSIRNVGETLLWGYTAPWYLGAKSQELMTLHK